MKNFMNSSKSDQKDILNRIKKQINLPDDYCNCSVQLQKTEARDQGHTGRCWIEAALAEIEYNYLKKTGTLLPELSSGFIAYYDLRLKVHNYLWQIYNTREKTLDDKQINFWISKPLQDAGQKDIFRMLIGKYGVVPTCYMPESVGQKDTGIMLAGLNQKLRFCAYQIRNGEDRLDVLEQDVFRLIDFCLGKMPETILFQGSVMTPVEFYQKYIKQCIPDREISFVNCPVRQRPYKYNYKIKWLYSQRENESPISYYNIDVDLFTDLAVCQLEKGFPVWGGVDAGHFSDKEKGIFDTGMYDAESLLGTKLELPKGEALLYRDSSMTHALLFCGVDIENGTIKRWCVKNSYGKKIGQDGYAYMSHRWFLRYVYQIVINEEVVRNFLPPDEIETAPVIWLPSWDGMGCLA